MKLKYSFGVGAKFLISTLIFLASLKARSIYCVYIRVHVCIYVCVVSITTFVPRKNKIQQGRRLVNLFN